MPGNWRRPRGRRSKAQAKTHLGRKIERRRGSLPLRTQSRAVTDATRDTSESPRSLVPGSTCPRRHLGLLATPPARLRPHRPIAAQDSGAPASAGGRGLTSLERVLEDTPLALWPLTPTPGVQAPPPRSGRAGVSLPESNPVVVAAFHDVAGRPAGPGERPGGVSPKSFLPAAGRKLSTMFGAGDEDDTDFLSPSGG